MIAAHMQAVIMDNNSVAILTLTNELLVRYGIHPCEVIVVSRFNARRGTALQFESPPPTDEVQARFFQMLGSLGITGHPYELLGDERAIYDKLQQAIDRAPRARARR